MTLRYSKSTSTLLKYLPRIHLLAMFSIVCVWPYFAFATSDIPLAERSKGPLSAEQAFQIHATIQQDHTFLLTWYIQPWYYLYADKFSFTSNDNRYQVHTRFINEQGSSSTSFTDPYFGQVQIYRNLAHIQIQVLPIQPSSNTVTATDIEKITLNVGYQGCWDGGICYPPQKLTLPLKNIEQVTKNTASTTSFATEPLTALSNNITPLATATLASDAMFSPAVMNTPHTKNTLTSVSMVDVLANQSDHKTFISLLRDTHIWLLWIIFYLTGIVLAFTPCIYPTLPLIGGVIAKQAKNLSSKKSITMVGTYVLCMSLTYAVAGMIAGLFGSNIQNILQQQWIIFGSVAFFILLAGSMFGFYTVQLPRPLVRKLQGFTNKTQSTGYVSLASMGVFSALIVSPCLTAPLAGILIFLADDGNPVKAAISLFLLGLGMGTPLIILSIFAGTLFPKAGAWMHRVNHAFGFGMLFVAVWTLERVIDTHITSFLYGIVVLLLASYLWQSTRDCFIKKRPWIETITRSASVCLFALAIAQIIHFAKPELFRHSLPMANNALAFPSVHVATIEDLQQQLATFQGTPVMLKYEAKWCTECRTIEREVMQNAQVQQHFQKIQTIVVDVTHTNNQTIALRERYNIPGPPALIFYHTNGKEQPTLRLIGNITVPMLLQRFGSLGV